MARRSSDSTGSVVLAAVALLFVFIKLLIGTAVSLCVYVGLPSLIVGATRVFSKRPELRAQCASILEAAGHFDWRSEKHAIQQLELQRRAAVQQVSRIYDLGNSKGWRRTDASEGRRFDRRNVLAERFNRELDELEAVSSSRDRAIDQLKRSVSERIPDWRSAHNTLLRLEASSAVLGVVALAYVGVFLLFVTLQPQWIQYLSDAAVFAIAPIQAAYGPAAIATAASLSLGALLHTKKLRELEASVNLQLVKAWKAVESAIDSADAVVTPDNESRTGSDRGSRRRRESPGGDSTYATASPTERAWFEVLGISEAATAEEVRYAWKQRMREYHPDTVASRGEKIRQLAAQETLAINEAYQTARRLGRA